MTFYTALSCLDGRIQLPVITHLQQACGVDYVDIITAPGPVRFFATQDHISARASMIEYAEVSLNSHNSQGLALVAHFDCAGNPLGRDVQVKQLVNGIAELSKSFPGVEIRALWVNADWAVEEIQKLSA